MPIFTTYIGTKIIQATPMNGAQGQPGYQVVYEDGYTSWSPSDVFEKAYRAIALPENFSALEPYQQRVVMEFAELSGKIERLTRFIEGDAFDDLSLSERLAMFAQLDAMKLYQTALKRRSDRFLAAWLGE